MTLVSHLLLAIAIIGILVVVNIINNKFVDRSYLLVCFIATAVLLALGRFDGLTWSEMGLGKAELVDGLIWGAFIFAGVCVFFAIAAAIPLTRKGFGDKRAAEQGWMSLLYNAMIRIPLGTALLEEVAFRGVLLAVVWDAWGFWWGVAVSSVVFGFWHVYPAVDFHQNTSAGALMGTGKAALMRSIALNVVGTALAGVVFCLLRYWSGSLIAPFVLHASLNGIGLAVSWAFARKLRDI